MPTRLWLWCGLLAATFLGACCAAESGEPRSGLFEAPATKDYAVARFNEAVALVAKKSGFAWLEYFARAFRRD